MAASVSAGTHGFRIKAQVNRSRVDNAGPGIRALDNLLFALYAFLYIAFFQVGLIGHVHQMLNEGAIPFRPLVVSLILTAVIVLVGIGISRLRLFNDYFNSCSYIPAALLMGAITSLDGERIVGHSAAFWTLVILSAVIFMLICRLLSGRKRKHRDVISALAVNLLIMFAVMLIPPLIGNTDSESHRLIEMQYYFDSEEYGKVLDVDSLKSGYTRPMERLRHESLRLIEEAANDTIPPEEQL